MQATVPSAEKKSPSCQVSVCFKLVNPLFFEANDRIEKKKSSQSTSNGFFCSLLLSSYKTEERGQKWIFFFCIKKEHFSMYLHVKQCAIENEVNSRSRCCMFANNSKLHMHYLTSEPNSLKNRIFGIYIFYNFFIQV